LREVSEPGGGSDGSYFWFRAIFKFRRFRKAGDKMARKTETLPIGTYSFLLGVFIAVLGGLVNLPVEFKLLLVILGFIVGILNITEKEIQKFLIATIALVMSGVVKYSQIIPYGNIGGYIEGILGYLVVFVAPAALVVALKAIYELAATR